MTTTALCHIDDLPDPGSCGFQIKKDDESLNIMVIRSGQQVYGYINSCPHTGVCLDWQPGQFLNMDETLIICAMHGAEFRIEDGYCVAGPCVDDQLMPVALQLDDSGFIHAPGHHAVKN